MSDWWASSPRWLAPRRRHLRLPGRRTRLGNLRVHGGEVRVLRPVPRRTRREKQGEVWRQGAGILSSFLRRHVLRAQEAPWIWPVGRCPQEREVWLLAS